MKTSRLLPLFILAACAATAPDPFPAAERTTVVTRQLELLASFYTGTFQSISQGKGEGDSRPVTLRVVRLWPERQGEFWYYLEYSLVGSEDKPYLQRIVRTGEARGEMLSAEYRIPGDPKAVVGEWKKPKPFEGVNAATLQEIPGCRMQLAMQHMTLFNGGTVGKDCHGHVPDGAYEVSDFFLSSSSLRSWDRGYDKSGNVVWGSEAGPIEFRRIAGLPR